MLATALRAADTLKDINVVAESIPATGDVAHSEYTGSHQQITRSELERGGTNLGDILARESGIQNRQSGGFGSFSSITMRAASSAQTGVYLDGILLNSGGNAIIDLSTLELLNVEVVDIYRGTSPLQLGNSTIGGAVNLKTLSAQAASPDTTLLLGTGSFATNRWQIAHQSRHSQWDVVGAASRQQSANDFEFNNNNGTPLNNQDDRREQRNNAGVTRIGALARLGYQWSDKVRTDVLLQANSRELGVPEWRNARSNEASFDTDNQQLQLSHSIDGIGNWNTRQTLFQHHQTDHFNDRLSQIGLGAQDSFAVTDTLGIKTYWERINDTGTLGLTAEIRRELLDSEDQIELNQNFNVSRTALSASVQYALFSLRERLLITPTLQWQSVSDHYNGVSSRNKNYRKDSVLSPQIGFRFEFNNDLSLRANIGRYHRQAAFYELFGSRGLVTGNTNLEPEKGINSDIGFSYKANTNWSIDANVFASTRTQLITTVYDSLGIGHTINAGKAQIMGVEVTSQWQLNPQLSARLNLTVQDTQSVSNSTSTDGKQLPGEAKHNLYAQLQYKHEAWRAWLEFDVKAGLFYDQANLLAAEDYWLQHAGVEWSSRIFKTNFSIKNISSRNIEDFNGFPRPGRSFFVNFKFTF